MAYEEVFLEFKSSLITTLREEKATSQKNTSVTIGNYFITLL